MPPSGVQGRAPVGVWGRSPPEAEALSINERVFFAFHGIHKYVRLRVRTYIHTCRSYINTPRDFTNAASLA